MAQGVPEGIGPIGALAPAAQPMRGRIVGLIPALRLLGGVAGPLAQARVSANKRVKEHNDAEGFRIEGQAGGRLVGSGPRGGGPPPRGPKRPSYDPEQDLEDAYETAHAKRMGRENRAAYRRWMGTPTRPPRESWGAETPFSEEYEPKHFQKPPRKPMDTSDIRRATP